MGNNKTAVDWGCILDQMMSSMVSSYYLLLPPQPITRIARGPRSGSARAGAGRVSFRLLLFLIICYYRYFILSCWFVRILNIKCRPVSIEIHLPTQPTNWAYVHISRRALIVFSSRGPCSPT